MLSEAGRMGRACRVGGVSGAGGAGRADGAGPGPRNTGPGDVRVKVGFPSLL